MSKLKTQIWNPWVETGQEEALDLSVKKEGYEEIQETHDQFDNEKFYKTYNLIAERERIVTLSYEQSFYPQNGTSSTFEKKRKLPSTFSGTVGIKKSSQDNKNKQRKVEKYQNNNIKGDQLKQSIEQDGKKSKKKDSDKIASIQSSCDCRFCYEDHILRMRLKITHQ